MFTPNHQRLWLSFCSKLPSWRAGRQIMLMSALGLALLSGAFGPQLIHAFAQTSCANGDESYTVVSGDTLSAIAARANTTWQALASHNAIANPDLIFADQHICIANAQGTAISTATQNASVDTTSNASTASNVSTSARGSDNPYPYGQCTWWASQRYFQNHGFFVPWTTNSDAWLWTSRAEEFGWHVSSQPAVGSIVDLQPWVQGAYSLGHVAYVEQVLSNGDVLASNMNWGGAGANIVTVEFAPGPGVTFLSA